MPYEWVKCLACNGTGYVTIVNPRSKKPETARCVVCDGTGQRYVKTK